VVAQLVRLKLTLLANTFRRSVWQTIGIVVGSVYALVIVGLVVVGAIAGGTADAVVTGQVVTIVGAVVVLAWWLVPIFLYGVDATLDPHRFATYGIPRGRLLLGLAVAGLVSVPGIATVLAAAGAAFAWWRSPLVVLAALVGAVLAVALCVVGSRAITTALAPLLESRRSREVLTIAAFVPVMLIGPAISWLGQRTGNEIRVDGGGLRAAAADGAALAGWTPFGAPWAFVSAVHDGDWLGALGRLAVALVALALLAKLWDAMLARSLERPSEGGGAQGARAKGLGFFDRVPATPVGAVAARTATYWLRDPRYSSSIVVVPLLPVILFFAYRGGGAAADLSGLLLTLAPLTAWILGFAISNDIGYDHTAFALHVATGTTGRADRWGRVVPVLVGGVPLVTFYAVLSAALSDSWGLLPPILGLTLGTIATACGVSSATSARWLYPVPKPGESPWKQPQGATGATMLAQAVNMGITLVVSIPALALTALAVFLPSPVLGWVTLVVAPAIGVVVLLLGVRWGAAMYDRRSPELLQRVLSYA
jgi:ABC-2 type transport system permease protein